MAKKKKSALTPINNKGAVGDINVTPLIDVVLVLLIIYMVVTPIMIHQMDINLPEKSETVPEDSVPEEQMLVAACEDGTFTFNRKAMPESDLIDIVRKKIIKKVRKGEGKTVFVDAHPNTTYPHVVQLLDAVREAGNQANVRIKIGLASLKFGEDFRACTPPEAKPVEPIAPAAEG